MTDSRQGFAAFFRAYTQTWVHTLSTVALTAFGLLTFVDRLFVVVAIAAYVVPAVVQYARRPSSASETNAANPANATNGRNRTNTANTTNGANPTNAANGTNETGAANPTTETNAANAAETAARSEGRNGARRPEGTGSMAKREQNEGPEPGEGDETPPEARWVVADAPTDETLFDAAFAEAGAYAAGSDGVVVARGVDRDGWEVVLADGPGARSNDLTGVDAAASGGVWVAGESGAVGRIDPESGRHVDYSAPDGDTNDVAAVAAAGSGGTETVLLADGSGRVRRGRYRGGELTWDDPVKPGSGSSVVGVELRGETGYVCDSDDGVFRTTDGGRTFESLDFEAANGTPTDVTAGGDALLVSDDDGAVHRRDGATWTPVRVCDDPLLAVAAAGADCVAVGEEAVYERTGSDWERADVPLVESLCGVAVGGGRAVAVGDAGTVAERVPGGGE